MAYTWCSHCHGPQFGDQRYCYLCEEKRIVKIKMWLLSHKKTKK
jgi:hypothetical protein